MERFDRIEEVYNAIIKVFIKNVTADKQSKFSEAYRKYLHNQYDKYFNENEESGFNNIANMCVSREKITNINKTEIEKEAMLFPDKEYIALENISLELEQIARLKKNGNTVNLQKRKEDYLKELKYHFAKVSSLFKYTAEKMLSEAILDLEYIFNDKEAHSFRM
ncbi:MAG: hypothetical protein IJQ07_06680 [Clostridia bacterium]|nr:hypothetical protein [Clostridia bacterium]